MMEARRHDYLSVEDYLRLEETSATRHEYVGGVLQALAGTSTAHNRIAGNIFAHLWLAARGSGCRVYMSDVMLSVSEQLFYYPDVMVTCDPADNQPRIVRNPCLAVEVLSPTTRQTDQREKLLAYRGLPSLTQYLIVEQDAPRVERHWRDERGVWRPDERVGSGTLTLACPGLELSLADIYEAVFDSEHTPTA